MLHLLPDDWQKILADEFKEPYWQTLNNFVEQAYQTTDVFPPKKDIFNAFTFTPFSDVKVVILGQDPYHGAGQAHGLSFSVQTGTKCPPSLVNIYKERETDIGVPITQDGNLTHWAKQGVLLLNTVLTVEKGQAHSHQKKGWEHFTDAVIQQLNNKKEPVIFVLWGKPAQQKKSLIDASKHHIIEAPHPSPLSAYRGFFGSKPFSTINHLLQQNQQKPISW